MSDLFEDAEISPELGCTSPTRGWYPDYSKNITANLQRREENLVVPLKASLYDA